LLATIQEPSVTTSTLIRKQVQLCDEAANAWRPDHDDAMQCRDLEEWLTILVAAYDLAVQRDEDWRLNVFRKQEPYDAIVHGEINATFEAWRVAAQKMEQNVGQLESKSFTVEHSAALRDRLREVEQLLTPDSKFFRDQKLVDLRDQALDAHAKGDTIKYRPG
jgi:hypothetical protein